MSRWEDNIGWMLGKLGEGVWTRFIWLNIGAGDGHVNTVMEIRVP